MIKKYTIQDALAFAAITGGFQGIHSSTVEAVEKAGLVKEKKDGTVKVLAAGRELAEKSRLYKAHQFLEQKGYEPLQPPEQVKSKLRYRNPAGREAIVRGAHVVSKSGRVMETFLNG